MRKSNDEAALTRKSIVAFAASKFRECGYDSVGLSDLMAGVGLTHGGFYKHFESKNQLIAEATNLATCNINDQLSVLAKKHSKNGLKQALKLYLNMTHRDNVANGCAFSALGPEIARADETTREVANTGFQEFVNHISTMLSPKETTKAKDQAIIIACSMVGALLVSRILNNPKSGEKVLTLMRDHLINSFDSAET